jgi:hypothetical protein
VKPGEAPLKALVRHESDGGQGAVEVGFPKARARQASRAGLEQEGRELELVDSGKHDERPAAFRPRARVIRMRNAEGSSGVAGLGGGAPGTEVRPGDDVETTLEVVHE